MAKAEYPVSTISRWPIRLRSVLGIVLGILCAAILLALPATTVRADEHESEHPLECLSCHQKTLVFHDSLGPGNQACWTCHDNTNMANWRLSNGTLVPRSESTRLCGQCHQKRYKAWNEGTHGFPGTIAIGKCTDCHNPHQPQVALLGITQPHPAPAPLAPAPNYDLVMIAIITVLFLTGLSIVLARQGKEI